MAIPEDRLKVWANQGATEGSKNTYTSIKAALDGYSWPEGMKPDIYLQGSYANSTNIRGNSDVDVVAEMTCVYYSNLTEADKPRVGWTPRKIFVQRLERARSDGSQIVLRRCFGR